MPYIAPVSAFLPYLKPISTLYSPYADHTFCYFSYKPLDPAWPAVPNPPAAATSSRTTTRRTAVMPTTTDPSHMPVTCPTPTAAASASASRSRGRKKGARGESPADWRSSHPLGNRPGGVRRARGLRLTRARMLQLNGECDLGFYDRHLGFVCAWYPDASCMSAQQLASLKLLSTSLPVFFILLFMLRPLNSCASGCAAALASS